MATAIPTRTQALQTTRTMARRSTRSRTQGTGFPASCSSTSFHAFGESTAAGLLVRSAVGAYLDLLRCDDTHRDQIAPASISPETAIHHFVKIHSLFARIYYLFASTNHLAISATFRAVSHSGTSSTEWDHANASSYRTSSCTTTTTTAD